MATLNKETLIDSNTGTLIDSNTDVMPKESIVLYEGFPGSTDDDFNNS